MPATFDQISTQTEILINCCLTGMVATKADNPRLPVSVDEIVADALAVWRLGASIVHLHARDKTGLPTSDPASYGEIISGIRATAPGLILCVSTSGRFWKDMGKRAGVLALEGVMKPDMASLTLGSMNFPRGASVNEANDIATLANLMMERGIRPELEAFDLGMIDYARHLAGNGTIPEPFYMNIILGNRGTAAATASNLAYLVDRLPPNAVWAACGIGVGQFRVNCLATAMGGHVRVGLEDNLYLDGREPATNMALVARAVKVAESMGRKPMGTSTARALLGLDARE